MNEGRKCVLASGSFTYDWPSCRRGGVLLHQQREAGGAHRLRQDGRGQRQLVAHTALAEKPAAVFALFLQKKRRDQYTVHPIKLAQKNLVESDTLSVALENKHLSVVKCFVLGPRGCGFNPPAKSEQKLLGTKVIMVNENYRKDKN